MDAVPISKRRLFASSAVVVLVAVAIRISSLSESYWIDELHSAWCVWGGWDDVFPRSVAGHQSPAYFLGLRLWMLVFGDSELAMRMSSVTAVASACGVLTYGVGRWTNSLIGGTASGLSLALETNSLFFGTELRPYAVVILASSIATTCFVRRMSQRDEKAMLGLIGSILLAAIVQPTSIGVLVWFPIIVFVNDHDRRKLLRLNRWTFVVLSLLSVTFVFLWSTTLSQSWLQRDQWASFATATSLRELWKAWDWVWLLLIPIALTTIGTLPRRLTFCLAMMAVGATAAYWVVSWLGWIPLWHRRYFIAVLPMIATVIGGAVGAVSARNSCLGWMAASVLVVGMTVRQSTFSRFVGAPSRALVVRGEDWRSAVEWVNANAQKGDRIFLDGGLIESDALSTEALESNQLGYLTFAVEGPYRVDLPVIPIGSRLSDVRSTESADTLIITRRPAKKIEADWLSNAEIRAFGNVTVVLLPGQG